MNSDPFQNIYQKLPQPYAITNSQIRSCYESFYTKLHESFISNDFYRINNLLEFSSKKSIIPNIKCPPPDDDYSDDKLLINLATLLYDIITIFPIKYYKTQYLAVIFLKELLQKNGPINGLTLDWRRYYKVFKKMVINCDFIFLKMKKDVNDSCLNFLYEINRYFPENDGQNNLTDQLVKKFIQKNELIKFDYSNPNTKGSYKLYYDYLLSSPINDDILSILNSIVKCNIEDDFTGLIPIVKQMTVAKILMNNNQEISDNFLYFLSEIFVSLFISPPTRKKILELFENLFQSLRSLCHPSASNSQIIITFINLIVIYLQSFLNKLYDDNKCKREFNMKFEFGPSQDEIHQLLKLTSEISINNIQNINHPVTVFIETKLDPSLINRYFDVSFQCINFIDAINVANGAWNILIALIMVIEKSDILLNNFESLFLFATKNIHHADIQNSIAEFILFSFIKIPFNKENTIEGLEYVNFSELANSYFTNLFSLFKSLPLADDGLFQIDEMLYEKIYLSVITLFANCDNSIFDELLPIFTSLAFDEGISPCLDGVNIIIINYCNFCSQEQSQKILKSFKRRLDLQNHSAITLTYLTTIYSGVTIRSSGTFESIKQSLEYLNKYFKNKNDDKKKMIIFPNLNVNEFNFDVNISLKKNEVKNIFEFGYLDNFDITYKYSNINLADLAFEILNPVYDKLSTSKNANEIIKTLDGIGSNVIQILCQNNFNSKSSTSIENFVNEKFNDSIYFVPELIKQTFPLKDKFIKCVIRILKDFPENEKLISNIIQKVYTANVDYKSNIDLISLFTDSYYYSKIKYNKSIIHYLLIQANNKRKNFLIFPLNDDYKQLIEIIVDLSVSKFKQIQISSLKFLKSNIKIYYPFINSIIIEKIFNKMDSIPYENFILFLKNIPDKNMLLNNDKLMCKVLAFLLKKFDSGRNLKPEILISFIMDLCFLSYPNGIYYNNKQEYVELLNEIEKENYLINAINHRIFSLILMLIILKCLKEVQDVSDKILEYVIRSITHYDKQVSVLAFFCLYCIVGRKKKITKEKITTKKFHTINTFPNIFDQISIEFPGNGFYFQIMRKKNEFDNDSSTNTDDKLEPESEPSASIDVNIDFLEPNIEIQKIFKSFQKIEIEWENDEFFESEYFTGCLFESYQFKRESYSHKKYEYKEDIVLIKSIKNIFASAMNSLNDKSAKNEIPYTTIWKIYASTIGPYCIKKLHKLCLKYLTLYYEHSPVITAKVLSDMIYGFFEPIQFWNIEDRIEFFKLVVLPVTCVLSSNPNTSYLIENIFTDFSKSFPPYYFASVLKVLYELLPNGPNIPFYGRTITSIIIDCIYNKPFFYFNSIDQLIEKFIYPFLDRFDEYKTNEIEIIIKLLFALIKCCSLKKSKSIFYSKEIEQKKKMIIQIFDSIFKKSIENEDVKNNLVLSFTHSFDLFINSNIDVRFILEPLFVKHLHKVFKLLNNNNFIEKFCLFIEDDIFFVHSEFEFEFVSSLIKEMMNSSILTQLTLSVNLNNNIEKNIFNISVDDYNKYEDLLLKYNLHIIEKNLGNEIRLNIAKILGIFEVRNCTFVDDPNQNIVDNLFKAGSIILNSFLFDHSDENVSKAFNFIEKFSSVKDSKFKDFYESVSKIFINRHSNHVINEAEELVVQYRNVSIPSYIC